MLPKTIACTLTAVPFKPGDPLDAAILDGLVPHPAIEDRHDRLPELILRVLGKRLLDVLLIDGLVAADQLLQVVGVQVGVELDAALFLERVELVLERLVLDPHRRRAEHIDQPAIAVVGEPRIAGLLGQALDRGVGQAEVQDRVHHARHRQGRSRADTDQQRIGRVAELLADRFFHARERRLDLRLDLLGKLAAAVVIDRANLGRDREARRNRNADQAHLGEVGPLAAQKLFHVGAALGRAAAKGINVLLSVRHRVPSLLIRQWARSASLGAGRSRKRRGDDHGGRDCL